MSKSMPDSEAELKAVPYITEANFEKYGKILLDITQKFSAHRLSKD